MPFAQTIQTALPITAHIAVKDTVQLGNSKTTFVLPGQAGTIDYVSLLKQCLLFVVFQLMCLLKVILWNQKLYMYILVHLVFLIVYPHILLQPALWMQLALLFLLQFSFFHCSALQHLLQLHQFYLDPQEEF